MNIRRRPQSADRESAWTRALFNDNGGVAFVPGLHRRIWIQVAVALSGFAAAVIVLIAMQHA